ncbi:MAG: type II toxin-antitoxin system prevent-host-death family antitoxin [Spirochaetales bacterium]|nr:type II toxin-antitoxin system prevent-host-death family antitoxin [Spirochaetales bacterium]
MKKASVAEVQHNLNSVLKFVEQGEKVLLTRRNKVIAKIVPVYDMENDDWPQFYERAKEMFVKTNGKNPEQIILDDREERF